MMKKILYYIRHWETWHWMVKYVPIAPAWIWFCIRSRNPWFFTTSNPSLKFGGFMGETKREAYKQLPPSLVPDSVYVSPEMTFSHVRQLYDKAGFSFPVIVKPDVGMMGFMFRKIDNIRHLRQYHDVMPADYIIQEYVDYPMEVSAFYYRMPNEKRGTITGFLKKEFLEVTGDGNSSLLELIQQYPRTRYRLEEMRSKHENHLHDILPDGEKFRLSYALNLSRGGKLVSLADEKDASLLKVFDELSHHSGKFFYGRYDIKCRSIEDLKQGRNFFILEYNGAGAEPHHVYGDGNSLWKACSILVRHWKMLYRISAYNHQQKGEPQWSLREGAVFARQSWKHYNKLRQLDKVFYFDKEASYVPSPAEPSIAGI